MRQMPPNATRHREQTAASKTGVTHMSRGATRTEPIIKWRMERGSEGEREGGSEGERERGREGESGKFHWVYQNTGLMWWWWWEF